MRLPRSRVQKPEAKVWSQNLESENLSQMSSESGGRRSPDEGTEAQSTTGSRPMNVPMKEPLRKTRKTIKRKIQKVASSAADKARRREQGSSRILLPPTNLPVSESGCVVAEPTTPIPLGTHPAPTGSIADYKSWLKEAGVHLRNYTFGDLPTYLSYAIHSTKSCHGYFCVSCHASFGTPRGLEQHIWGTSPTWGSPCWCPYMSSGTPSRGPSAAPSATLRLIGKASSPCTRP
ncbi:Hypothetical protein GLP15_1966 [Giardia lamblia P15]|uniref:Uncharacterized protein n=1 Tax=Giardia intestinalis (strain P15) TaxID=658858 RepID=E1F666_GIAIA|nr:Hypothetical protein GLP15_1966 [Giardia lamblia P15]